MAFGLDPRKNVLDFAIGTNDESGADDAHHFFAVHIFFLKNAECVGDFFIGVSEEREREVKFILKFLLRFGRVGGEAE